MSVPPYKLYHRARQSNVCLCGLPKRTGHLFCLACGCRIPREMRDQMRDSSFRVRLVGFIRAAEALGVHLMPEVELSAVFLSEEQLTGIFLGATLEGKQLAVQALLDWSRIPKPKPLLDLGDVNETLEEMNA